MRARGLQDIAAEGHMSMWQGKSLGTHLMKANLEQLREAIEAPAALNGVAIEPALVQRLLVDASTVPDELPRLQHLLMRLWEHREQSDADERMTLGQYRLAEIGGRVRVAGSLAMRLPAQSADCMPPSPASSCDSVPAAEA